MKTERRHELETNVLASQLAVWIEKCKPYTTTALVAVLVVAIGYVGYQFSTQQSEEQRAEAWNAYFKAIPDQDVDKLTTEVIQKYPGADAAQWAQLAVADRQMAQGMSLLFRNKVQADELLEKAGSTYLVLQDSGNHETLRQQAAMSRARVLEGQSKLEAAKKAYGRVTGIFAEQAKAQIKRLEQQDSKDFYDWFATAEPAQLPNIGGPGVPGVRPDFNPSPLSGLDGNFLPGFGPAPESSGLPGATDQNSTPGTEPDSGDAPASSDDPSSGEPSTGADAEPAAPVKSSSDESSSDSGDSAASKSGAP